MSRGITRNSTTGARPTARTHPVLTASRPQYIYPRSSAISHFTEAGSAVDPRLHRHGFSVVFTWAAPPVGAQSQHGEQYQSVATQFQSVGGRTHSRGPARTLKCFENKPLLQAMIATPGDGAVLVVDGGGSLDCELMGGTMAKPALDNGWARVIIHGAVRDRGELAVLPIGVKALGSNPRKSRKNGSGQQDVEVSFGGATFHPGATVHCDDDGILAER